jgi:predicted amidohydrolase YtcJ
MADLTLVNANVLTMDPDPSARPRAGAVAITGGRIEAVAASGLASNTFSNVTTPISANN